MADAEPGTYTLTIRIDKKGHTRYSVHFEPEELKFPAPFLLRVKRWFYRDLPTKEFHTKGGQNG
jgi:hypothetical protein